MQKLVIGCGYLGHRVAKAMQQPGADRDRLTTGMFVPEEDGEALQRLELALQLSAEAEPVLKKIKDAVRAGTLPRQRPEQLVDEAMLADVVTKDEGSLVRKAEKARLDAITVDAFTLAEYLDPHHQHSEAVSTL